MYGKRGRGVSRGGWRSGAGTSGSWGRAEGVGGQAREWRAGGGRRSGVGGIAGGAGVRGVYVTRVERESVRLTKEGHNPGEKVRRGEALLWARGAVVRREGVGAADGDLGR
jgi:hypothetical protein